MWRSSNNTISSSIITLSEIINYKCTWLSSEVEFFFQGWGYTIYLFTTILSFGKNPTWATVKNTVSRTVLQIFSRSYTILFREEEEEEAYFFSFRYLSCRLRDLYPPPPQKGSHNNDDNNTLTYYAFTIVQKSRFDGSSKHARSEYNTYYYYTRRFRGI